MKYITITLLLLAIATNTYSACCADCMKNIKADTGKLEGDTAVTPLTLLTTPVTTGFDEAKLCGKVWKANDGACVDQDKLIEYLKQRRARRNGRNKGFFKAAKTFIKALEKIPQILTQFEANKTKFLAAKKPERGTKKGPPSGTRILADATNTEADFNKIKDSLTVFKTNAAAYKTMAEKLLETGSGSDMAKCFVEKQKIRARALCIRTSGKGSDFLDAATDSYKIKESICEPLIAACGAIESSLNIMRSLSNLMNDITVSRGGAKSKKIKPEAIDKAKDEKFAKCGKDAAACSKGSDKKTICQSFALVGEPNDPSALNEGAGKGDGLDKAPSSSTATRLLLALRQLQETTEDNGYIQVSATGYDLNAAAANSGDDTTTFVGGESSSAVRVMVAAIIGLAVFLF